MNIFLKGLIWPAEMTLSQNKIKKDKQKQTTTRKKKHNKTIPLCIGSKFADKITSLIQPTPTEKLIIHGCVLKLYVADKMH